MLIIFFLLCAQGFEQGLVCAKQVLSHWESLAHYVPMKTILSESHSCLVCDLSTKPGPNDIFDLYVQIYKQLNFQTTKLFEDKDWPDNPFVLHKFYLIKPIGVHLVYFYYIMR